jgi:hypothetical protein
MYRNRRILLLTRLEAQTELSLKVLTTLNYLRETLSSGFKILQ